MVAPHATMSPPNSDSRPPSRASKGPFRGHQGPLEVLEGSIERVTFHSEESLYTVLRVRSETPIPALQNSSPIFSPQVTAVGATPRPSEGLDVRLSGRWGKHSSHGLQFEFESLEVRPPKDPAGLIKYLSSDRFTGIGRVTATKIVDALGTDALTKLRDDPAALAGLGLKPEVASALRDSVQAEFGTHALHAFLTGLGLGPWAVEQVVQKFGQNAETLLRRDPYLLSVGVDGIGFLTADKAAHELGLPADGIERRRAAVQHLLREAAGQGHSFQPTALLAESTRELLRLEVPDADFVEALEGLRRMDELVLDREGGEEREPATLEALPIQRAWLPPQYHHETGLADKLTDLVRSGRARPRPEDHVLADIERRSKFELHSLQREAIAGLASHPVGVLTGGPGVGKTTVLRLVVQLAHGAGSRVLLASPTGRAAKRLAEATGHEAATVHRLLGFDPAKQGFSHDADNPLDCDLVIVDEISMLDLALAHRLISAIKPPTRIILVGDPDQLPSVAAGNVLADILDSGQVPTYRLTQIFRQSAESRIVVNAHRILEGRPPELPTAGGPLSDFYLFPTEGEIPTAERLVEVVTERIPQTFGLDWINDVQVLSPMYRGECGVDALNERLRQRNTKGGREGTLRGRVWREGDRVIHTRNDYDKDVFNGDMGRITRINQDGSGLMVQYPEKTVFYEPSDLGDLQPAFAITVHRSQGGEFKAVVLPIVTNHFVMLQRHLLYTAVTRAKQLCVLVGQPKALEMAIENAEQKLRRSALAERLRSALR